MFLMATGENSVSKAKTCFSTSLSRDVCVVCVCVCVNGLVCLSVSLSVQTA